MVSSPFTYSTSATIAVEVKTDAFEGARSRLGSEQRKPDGPAKEEVLATFSAVLVPKAAVPHRPLC